MLDEKCPGEDDCNSAQLILFFSILWVGLMGQDLLGRGFAAVLNSICN